MSKRLEEIRKLCEAATPGPWKYDWGNWKVEQEDSRDDICNFACLSTFEGKLLSGNPEDGEFIAAARTLLPLLLDVAEAAEVSNRVCQATGHYFYGAEILDRALERLEHGV